MSRVIDLSLPVFEGMPHYPTDPPTIFRAIKSIEKDRTRVTELRFGSHAGTHVDVPSHVLPDGKSLEQMDLSSFLGSAIKLRLDRFTEYDLSRIEYDGVLLDTGWGRCYGAPPQILWKLTPLCSIARCEQAAGKETAVFRMRFARGR